VVDEEAVEPRLEVEADPAFDAEQLAGALRRRRDRLVGRL
jgi:hypothetical protein